MHALPLAIATFCLLAGCARDDNAYPSLAQRPAELRGFAEPDAPAEEAPRADPALDARVAAMRTSLATVAAGFDRDFAKARAAAGRPGARSVGGDAWLDAQSALAALDDRRAQASSLAVDVDDLASERAAALQPPYPAVEELRRAASAEVSREDAEIARLTAALPSS